MGLTGNTAAIKETCEVSDLHVFQMETIFLLETDLPEVQDYSGILREIITYCIMQEAREIV